MKSLFKRTLAVLVMAAMVVLSFAGCSKSGGKSEAKADTMFGILKEASSLSKCTFTLDANANVNDVQTVISMSGRSDGKATVLSVTATVSGMKFELNDILTFTDDELFISVKSIEDSFGAYLDAYDIDLADYGIDKDYIVLKAEGLFKKDLSGISAIYDDLDKAYADIIEKKDGAYTITLKGKESINKFTELTKKMLTDNADSWADIFAKETAKYDVEKIVNDFVDEVVAELKDSLGDAIDEQEIKDAISEELVFDENPDKEEIKDAILDAADSISVVDEVNEDDSLEYSISSSKGEYTIKANATVAYDDMEEVVEISSVIKEGCSDKVTVPSDDDAISIAKIATLYFMMSAE